MTVSSEERDFMQNLLDKLNGEAASTAPVKLTEQRRKSAPVELAGPGGVTESDIQAMSQVLSRLDGLATELVNDPEPVQEFSQALAESRNKLGVKVGKWQIAQHEDAARLAGKQYFSIYHSETNQVIANDISLYETALRVARLLNSGEYVNSVKVRELFEQDDSYTSHKIDAHRFYIRSRKSTSREQKELYENRMQASKDRAQMLRAQLKKNLDL
jgi:hypothetical protein